jgi:hypothetical protein
MEGEKLANFILNNIFIKKLPRIFQINKLSLSTFLEIDLLKKYMKCLKLYRNNRDKYLNFNIRVKIKRKLYKI